VHLQLYDNDIFFSSVIEKAGGGYINIKINTVELGEEEMVGG
jgi:hypothetical protein